MYVAMFVNDEDSLIRWVEDNSTVPFTNWEKGQPDEGPDEDCMAIELVIPYSNSYNFLT